MYINIKGEDTVIKLNNVEDINFDIFTDTYGSTATAESLLEGYTAWANGKKLKGTFKLVSTDGTVEITDNCDLSIAASLAVKANIEDVYDKRTVDEKIAAIATLHFEVVPALPQVGEPNIIYLVPKGAEKDNNYDEYIYVGGKWEIIGSTSIDLSNYYTKAQTDALVNAKQDKIADLQTIREGAEKGSTALQEETDPTVPSWAKEPNKPTYTASEVGAVTEDEVKELLKGKQDTIEDLEAIREGAEKGATALQEETDPTVPQWAKEENKPTYTAEEVGAMPADAKVVKTVNGTEPDENGNVNVEGGGGSGDFQTVDGKPMWKDEFLVSGKYEQGWAKIYDMRLADGSIRPAFGETIKWATTQQTYNVSPYRSWGRLAFNPEGVNITFYDLSTRGFPNNKIQLTVDGEVLEYQYNTVYFVGKDSTLKFDLLKKEGDDWVVDNDAWAYKGMIMSGQFIDYMDVFSEVTKIDLHVDDTEVITRPTLDIELAKKADKSDAVTNIYVTGDGSYRKDGSKLYVTSPVVNDNNVANSPQAGLHYGIDIVSLDTWGDIISNKFYEINPLNTEYVINNIFEDGSLNYRVNLGIELSMKVPIADYPNTTVSLMYKDSNGIYSIQTKKANDNGLVYFNWFNGTEKVWFRLEPFTDASMTTIVEDYVYGTPIDGTVLSTKMQAKAYIKYDGYTFGKQDIHLATKDDVKENSYLVYLDDEEKTEENIKTYNAIKNGIAESVFINEGGNLIPTVVMENSDGYLLEATFINFDGADEDTGELINTQTQVAVVNLSSDGIATIVGQKTLYFDDLATKSDFKTINGESIIGEGNIEIKGGGDYLPLSGGTLTGHLTLGGTSETSFKKVEAIRNTNGQANGAAFYVNSDGTAAFFHKAYNGQSATNDAILKFDATGLSFAKGGARGTAATDFKRVLTEDDLAGINELLERLLN